MDPTQVNSFLDQFLAMASNGFGLIQGDVTYVLNALIAISIVLAGVQWVLMQEAPLAPFFRKVLFIGFFAFLINNWNAIATAINHSGALLGLRAGGSSLTLADLHNPGRIAGIGTELFGRTVALSEGMNIITDFVPLITTYVAAFFVMIGFFLLALQLFVMLIAFKLGSLAAFVALPWGVFSGTAWIAERPLGWVVGSAVRLFVLGFVASISISFVDSLPATLTLDAGGALNVLLFGLTVMALAWFGPVLASEVVQGQPHLSGADAFRAGLGATVIGGGAALAGGVVATRMAIGGARLMGRAGGATKTAMSNRGGGKGGGGSGARPAINYADMQPKPAPPPPPSSPSSGGSNP
ncbi:MAG: P-type conjugative transfer protein TrbL [Hyphomonadaceae bacterium]|nr:P-type conjugative transfer protein TrbL [Hyphomonadaceae bacterium]